MYSELFSSIPLANEFAKSKKIAVKFMCLKFNTTKKRLINIMSTRNREALPLGVFAQEIQKKNKANIAHIVSSANNTIITVTDLSGNTKAWASCGSQGFKGSRRKTSYAAQATAEAIGTRCQELGITRITIRVRGFGPGRDSCIRGLHNSGLVILSIQDCTPIPHNGCRPPKRTRG